MREAQEMLGLKQIASQTGQDYQELLSMLEQVMKKWARLAPQKQALRRTLDKQDGPIFSGRTGRQHILNLFDALDLTQNHMRLMEGKLQTLVKSSEQTRRAVGVMVDTIVQDMKKVLMLPFSSFLEAVPKMVRDLSRDQGKDVRLVMEGSEVEIDRRVLEEMRDPLIHILRNSVDHGIEKPGARIARNKPGTGTIKVAIKQVNGNKVEIAVADDGAGVDIEKVKKAAVKRGFISGDQGKAMDDEAAMSLIFVSEISTSPIVTDISGRGLGLAIVREKVENLGGKSFAQSQPGQGAEFRIIIPITLATFRGLMLRVGEQWFIVPTINVEQAVRIRSDEIRTVENRETISLNGRTFSFAWLADVLELLRTENNMDRGNFITALILSAAGNQLAFGVDEVINEEEVLLKPLGRQLSRVRNVYGAAVLGSGKVVAVLNVADLIKSAAAAPSRQTRVEPSSSAGAKINILVAEDSITSRMLLKNILESAGYVVKTVTDGLEALTELKQGNYDLLVSDVDMPRMNGFVLTSNIRAEKKLADLPVVLVTALQSREDRERGIDAGANAYIIKSTFDQSNLLDVIKKFI
jgi:two-component system, chemotaxis family, sensor kinase CheA